MDHGNMDMGGDATCTHSMVWNWNTIGACFFAESWRIGNDGMMAASCIGVFLLVICLELLRRIGKEYDNFILRQFQQHVSTKIYNSRITDSDTSSLGPKTVTFRATPLQQLIRSIIHALTFGVAYILMLIAMSFNGYIIISIIIGAGIGKFLCDWMIQKVVVGGNQQAKASTESDEPSVCCG
ncbi:Ctr-domain-containing protein [Xylariaceae sp. FL0662B]|nr:Ctr-domain-containing protein [Xylariaceae sp. FL0662B]